MDTKIKKVGTLDHVNLFYDPLKKDGTFLLMKKSGEGNVGYLMIPPEVYTPQTQSDNAKVKVGVKDVDAVIEAGSIQTSWEDITGIIAGFQDMEIFEKVKKSFNEKNK